MKRVSYGAPLERRLPILVAVSVLAVAFSLASLRTDAAEDKQRSAISDAQIHFNDIVSDKGDQIQSRLKHLDSLSRGVYSALDTGIGSSLPAYLETALVFDTNASLMSVTIIDLSGSTPTIVQAAAPEEVDLVALATIIFALPEPQDGVKLRLLDEGALADEHLLLLTYHPDDGRNLAVVTIFDGAALLGTAIGGDQDLQATLRTPAAGHTFLGYGIDGEPHLESELNASSDPPAGHSHLQEISDFRASSLFDRAIEVSVYGDPWLLRVTMAESFLQIPESQEADAIVAAGVVFALLGYFVTLQVMHAQARDRKRLDLAELGRSETEQRLIHGFDQSPIGVAELTFSGVVERANASMTRLLGLQPGDLDDTKLAPYLLPEYEAAHKVRLQHLQKQGFGATKSEVRYVHADRSVRVVRENISVVPESIFREAYILLQAEDITEEKRALDELASRALRDELTGIPNRALFSDRLAHELSSRSRTNKSLSVMFIDVDHFKVVNDSLGHSVGDTLITEMAHRLKSSIRDCDTVARFGGDEFVILTTDIASQEEAVQLADQICKIMCEPYDLGNRQIRATVSIGITLSYAGADVETLLRNADIALYKAKDNGRDRAELFTLDMHTDAVARQTMAEELRTAIGDGELRAWYQPIVSATTGEVRGVEALVRWEHPTRGILSPFHFLGIAAEIGMSSAIDDWVLASASTQLQKWSQEFDEVRRWTLSVNATPKHLLEDGYVESVDSILKIADFSPHRLIIEVTEDSMLSDLDSAAEVVRVLASMGVRVAIDDFGTGYSSMSMLATLKVNRLKIDASFVQSMRESRESASIVESCISLAKSLEIPVVAEGVEELEDLAAISEAGADLIQGYVYSRPRSAAIIEDILYQHSGQWSLKATSPNSTRADQTA